MDLSWERKKDGLDPESIFEEAKEITDSIESDIESHSFSRILSSERRSWGRSCIIPEMSSRHAGDIVGGNEK